MNRYGSNVSHGFHIPDFFKQLVLCKYPVRILRQKYEQIELFCRKLLFLFMNPDPSGRLIDADSADLYNIVLRHAAANQPFISCQMRLDSCHQLAG